MANGWSVGSILRDLRTAWRLLLDPRVPFLLKLLVPVAAIIYMVSPLDIMPLNPIDDWALLILAAKLFVNIAPRDAVYRAGSPASGYNNYRNNGGDANSTGFNNGQYSQTIDGSWEIVDE